MEPNDGIEFRLGADIAPLRAALREAGSLSGRFAHDLTRAFENAALKGRSLSEVLRQLAFSLSSHALEAALAPLTKALGGGLAQLVGGGLQSVLPFASGGVIASPVTFPLADAVSALPARRGLKRLCRWRAAATGASAFVPKAEGKRSTSPSTSRRKTRRASAARKGRSRRCSIAWSGAAHGIYRPWPCMRCAFPPGSRSAPRAGRSGAPRSWCSARAPRNATAAGPIPSGATMPATASRASTISTR